MSNDKDKANDLIKHNDLSKMFETFTDRLSELSVILPGSNIYVDGQRDTQKQYPAIQSNYIEQLPTPDFNFQQQSIICADNVYDKLVDAAVKFNQIRKVNVEVWHAIGTASYSTVSSIYTISGYVSMKADDIQAVDEPNISNMTYDFNMFTNNTESNFRHNLSTVVRPDDLSQNKLIKYSDLSEFITDLYDKWKSELDSNENMMTFNVYSCHSNCHSVCHGNSRSRR